MTISLEHIVRSGAHLELAADTAGYLVLAVAEQCLHGTPADESSIHLEEAGTITVHPRGSSRCAPDRLAAALGRLLSSAKGDNPGLVAIAAKPASELEQFVGDLRAALVPLNRPAARRALVRLHRQLERLGPQAEAMAPGPRPSAPVIAPGDLEDFAANVDLEPAPERTIAIVVPTPRLGSLRVEPHVQTRKPAPRTTAVAGEPTRALWLPTAPEETAPLALTRRVAERCEAPQAPVALSPSPNPTTRAARHSDVRELVSGFRVEPAPSEAQLLAALQVNVDSHGTPMPPVAQAAGRASRR